AAQEAGLPLYRYVGGTNARTLPVPLMNILNGGSHADNKIDFQEFMIVPFGAPTFSEALRWGTTIFHNLKAVLKEKAYTTSVENEGGYARKIQSNEEAIETVIDAMKVARFTPRKDVGIALDPAISELYLEDEQKYQILHSDGRKLSADEMVAYWAE